MNAQQKRMVSELVGEGGLAIQTTCGANQAPHAAWMTAVVSADLKEVIAITSPVSQKARNLRENPFSEWMFSSVSLETVAYLAGKTEIVEDPEEARRCWDQVPGKANAFYRHYQKPEDPANFAVIRTRVSDIQLVKPMGYRKAGGTPEEVELTS